MLYLFIVLLHDVMYIALIAVQKKPKIFFNFSNSSFAELCERQNKLSTEILVENEVRTCSE